jgi:hypothetical protein
LDGLLKLQAIEGVSKTTPGTVAGFRKIEVVLSAGG